MSSEETTESFTLWGDPEGIVTYPTLKNHVYICPKHGEVTNTLLVDLKSESRDGVYCMICCVDKIIDLGVCKVTEKVDE